MPYIIPNYAQLVQTQKQELANLNPDLSLQDDDDEMVRAHGVAAVVEGAYQHQQWIIRQLFAQTAEKEFLDYLAAKVGITRKQAVAATGSIKISGTEGASLSIGANIVRNAYTWITTSLGTIDDTGFATVNVIALTTGTAGNLSENTPVTLASAPIGIQSQALALTMSGGSEQESDDDLRARVLFAQQNPEGNGTKADYVRWAMAIEGVSSVYVFSRRRGLGTVDLCIGTATGLPSPTLIADVQAEINLRQSEPADCLVYAPQFKFVNMGILVELSGTNLAAITPLIVGVLVDYFATLNPADRVVIKQIEALIMSLEGVVDVKVNSPNTNIVPEVSLFSTEWCRLGDVEVNVLS
ncbi:baseplate J/gp47 family protein [Agitococcus lubricus]|uniref:Putative phage protein gp47/JayE n=1 Tax=Agitococcus lubricus TaxID=1077255 RepID=A0A2T5J3V8_9GAMM|nr:baseplate J/gp47 family protein [Agitococcus lubricus]PTQ91281.1 putative phage protein gp47/JayE [Agitococcus lubricus]